MARPTKLNREMAKTFFSRLIEMGSVEAACNDEEMPGKSTIFKWLAEALADNATEDHVWFLDHYKEAQSISADYEIDSAVNDIVRNSTVTMEHDGVEVSTVTGPSVAFARLVFDATKWRAGKKNGKYLDGARETGGGAASMAEIMRELASGKLPD